MDLDLICTFKEREQEWFTVPLEAEQLKDKETLTEYVLSQLTDVEKEELIKVSCCVLNPSMDPPDWYMECNGKLWFDE